MNYVIIIFAALVLGVLLIDKISATEAKVKRLSVTKSKGDSDDDDNLFDDWWETAMIYEILPRSFKDSDNDGNGDLQGVIEKLDYLKDLGVDAVSLAPIYKSPQVYLGYDISDYRDIDPIFGTLEDLRELIDKAHQLNIKVIVDYVPNHTSDQHEWFQASSSRDSKYEDYYIWKNATYVDGGRTPPNNWVSVWGGSAWEWSEERQQYYYHQFSPAQPDLNFRNSDVAEELKDVLKYWLNFGVDGFRVDELQVLLEDALLTNETFNSDDPSCDADSYSCWTHDYTWELSESFDMLYQWRDVIEEFNTENDTYTRVLIVEGPYKTEKMLSYYYSEDGTRAGGHFTLNYETFISSLAKNFTSHNLFQAIDHFMDFDIFPGENYVLGNHDVWRVSTRLGVENIDALNMLALLIRGIQITYQGEEIGQENGEVTCEEGHDPKATKNCATFDTVSRDFEQTPFQWDSTPNAGFNTGAKAWLPVSSKYIETNLASQNIPGINSHYNNYKQMVELRREFLNTSTDTVYFTASSNLFFLERYTDNADYALYWNIGDTEEYDSADYDGDGIIVLRSNSDYSPGDAFNSSQPLKPREALLFKMVNTSRTDSHW